MVQIFLQLFFIQIISVLFLAAEVHLQVISPVSLILPPSILLQKPDKRCNACSCSYHDNFGGLLLRKVEAWVSDSHSESVWQRQRLQVLARKTSVGSVVYSVLVDWTGQTQKGTLVVAARYCEQTRSYSTTDINEFLECNTNIVFFYYLH